MTNPCHLSFPWSPADREDGPSSYCAFSTPFPRGFACGRDPAPPPSHPYHPNTGVGRGCKLYCSACTVFKKKKSSSVPTMKNQENHIKIWLASFSQEACEHYRGLSCSTPFGLAGCPGHPTPAPLTVSQTLRPGSAAWAHAFPQLPSLMLPVRPHLQLFHPFPFSAAHLASWQPCWARIRVHTLHMKKLPKGIQLLRGPLALRPSLRSQTHFTGSHRPGHWDCL